ncbi:MAG: hypothetical protein BWZ07_02267 [Alphaproteobacteria bacterium ADurb.BinA280]|nr:MAG: hypothetical protein BWZ07_02267 [Alphaproteobacteria bacterium ADurb.BinA280]
MRHLVFHEVVEIPNRTHARPLVDGLLDFRRHGHVLDHKGGDLDAVLLAHHAIDQRQQRLAQLAIPHRHIQRGDLGRRQRLRKHADQTRTHGVGELVKAEVLIGTRHFLEKLGRFDDAEIIGTKRPQTHHAEVGVAHHHRIRRAPLVAREQARVEVVDITLEGRIEPVFPARNRRQNRNVLGLQGVLARPEQIGVLASSHKLRQLRLAHNQLRAVLDLLVVIRPAVRKRVPRIVGPLDDLDQLAFDEIQNAHACLRWLGDARDDCMPET